MDDNQNKVVDAEIVEEEVVVEQPDNGASQALILQNLESLIRENLATIDKLGSEANKNKEMIDSVLGNDEVYRNHDEAAKEAQKVKNSTKQEILKRPDVAHVVSKLKEIKEEIKEIKESMNSYLQEYERLSGTRQIEDDMGGVLEIVYSAKLVKRKA